MLDPTAESPLGLADRPLNIVFFGLSITSSWGNGHATTYRGLLRALAARGHRCTFLEQVTEYYAANRDLNPAQTDYANVCLYSDWDDPQTREAAAEVVGAADVVIIGSYCFAGAAIIDWAFGQRHSGLCQLYYDIDTPVTLDALRRDGATPYLAGDQLTGFDGVLSFTGGAALTELRERWGAHHVAALYCGFDPAVHHPAPPDDRFTCALGYMGTYSADRQATVDALLLAPAAARPAARFLIAGPQYPDPAAWPANVGHIPHLYPQDHAAFYSSNGLTLNATRGPMVRTGYCPSVRLFEAAGCGACILSDRWPGLDELLTPGSEIWLAATTADALAYLDRPAAERAAVGAAARARALRDHTYAARAAQLEAYMAGLGA
ncbi:MAG: glycosyltransferase [Chloroflexota bacterium]|nr:glycosyltransferase [Chloroflexota bacterium]